MGDLSLGSQSGDRVAGGDVKRRSPSAEIVAGTRGRGRQQWWLALALAVAILAGGVAIGYQSDFAAALAAGPSGTVEEASPGWLRAFMGVLVANGPALLLVYSGVLSCGLGTFIAWPLIAAYIGSTLRTGGSVLGLDAVVGSIWVYAPLEFAALALAATAGLLPLVAALGAVFGSRSEDGPLRAYVAEATPSLRTLGIAFAILVVAAALEAVVIVAR